MNFNEEQLRVINCPLSYGSIFAPPGSGKTTTITYKVYNHFLNKELKKDEFLMQTFSKDACEDIIQKGKDKYNKLFTKENTRTIHSLAGKICNELINKESKDISTIVSRAKEEINKMSEDDIKTKLLYLSKLKIIFVDEAQDLSEIQYNFICSISEKYKVPIICIGDPNQNIYQFQGGCDKYLLNHAKKYNGFEMRLNVNYRSIKPILDIVNLSKIYDRDNEILCSKKCNEDYKPLLFNGAKDEGLHHLLKFCNENYKNNITAVIGPVKKSKIENITFGLEDVISLFRENKIECEVHYNIVDKNNKVITKKTKEKMERGKVHFYTIHASKGLEFDSLGIINFHKATMNRDITTLEEQSRFRFLWFVALSRAKERLNIYTSSTSEIWSYFKEYKDKFDIVCKFKDKMKIGEILIKDKFKESQKLVHSVTDLLSNREYINEDKLLELQKICDKKWDTVSNKIDIGCPENELPMWSELCTVYGDWSQNLFEYYYLISNKNSKNKYPQVLRKMIRMLNNCVHIPKKLKKDYEKMCELLSIEDNVIIKEQLFDSHDFLVENNLQNIYHFLQFKQSNDNGELICLVNKDTQFYDFNNLKLLVNTYKFKIDHKELKSIDIFEMCLFMYQFDNECKRYWEDKNKFINDIEIKLNFFSKNITKLAYNYQYTDIIFERRVEFKGLNIIGRYDLCINKNRLVELKFASGITTEYKNQITIYKSMIDYSDDDSDDNSINIEYIEVWNLYNNEIIRSSESEDINFSNRLYWFLQECLMINVYNPIWIIDYRNNTFQAVEFNTMFKFNDINKFMKIFKQCKKPKIIVYDEYPEIISTKIINLFEMNKIFNEKILINIITLYNNCLSISKYEPNLNKIYNTLYKDKSQNKNNIEMIIDILRNNKKLIKNIYEYNDIQE